MKKLHYIYDPLCGWCYAAAPLLDAIIGRYPSVPLELHAGGLFSQQAITDDLAAYVRPHDARIQQLTGQPFGDGYLLGLLNDRDAVLDSARVIAGILALETLLPRSAIAMLKRIQHAHYVLGRKVVEEDVLKSLAGEVSPAVVPAFSEAYAESLEVHTPEHLSHTRILMSGTGVTGFPGFVAERHDGFQRLEHGPFLGDPAGFTASIEAMGMAT